MKKQILIYVTALMLIGGAAVATYITNLPGTLDVTGAATMDSTLTVAGLVTADSGFIAKDFSTKTDNYTVLTTDCGTTLATATDAKTFTLPAVAAANAGCELRFVNTGAAAAVLLDISPAAADGIYGRCSHDGGVPFSGTDDADVGNTKATAQKGDNITMVSDGSTGWFVNNCVGEWKNN